MCNSSSCFEKEKHIHVDDVDVNRKAEIAIPTLLILVRLEVLSIQDDAHVFI